MLADNLWPCVSLLLQRAYVEKRRAWIADPENKLAPLPKRRSRKRKPAPGAQDAVDPENG